MPSGSLGGFFGFFYCLVFSNLREGRSQFCFLCVFTNAPHLPTLPAESNILPSTTWPARCIPDRAMGRGGGTWGLPSRLGSQGSRRVSLAAVALFPGVLTAGTQSTSAHARNWEAAGHWVAQGRGPAGALVSGTLGWTPGSVPVGRSLSAFSSVRGDSLPREAEVMARVCPSPPASVSPP